MGTTEPGASRAVLSAEVSAFLVQFSIYLSQCGAYPSNHPLLAGAAQAAVLRLHSLLLDREVFAIGVAGDRLLIEGAFTDPNHGVLRELARHLHRQQLGAIRFHRGVGAHEMEDLVTEIAAARRSDQPVGRDLEPYRQRWAHITLEPQAYDQIRMADGEAGGIAFDLASSAARNVSEGQRLWMALAAAAMAGEAGIEERSESAAELARSIALRREDAEYDRVIVEYLLQLGRHATRQRTDSSQASARIQELLSHLDAETLERLLVLGATLEERRELVELAARDMPINSVVLILHSAAGAERQSISHNLLRILNKMALQAGPDAAEHVRKEADAAARDTVRRLLEDWKLEDPNPGSHTRVLDRLAASGQGTESGVAVEHSAFRIVQMSLELDVAGAMLWDALDAILDRGEVRQLLDLLQEAGTGHVVDDIWDHLATPGALEHLLSEESTDTAAVEELISRLGPRAAAPMLDALSISESRAVRRRLLTWLGSLGNAIAPLVMERLPVSPWYVQRNLLALLASMPELPPDLELAPYLAHPDTRVRREALKVLFASPEQYDEGVAAAVRDPDPQIVTMGLSVAADRLPGAATAAVVAVARRKEWPSNIRVQAIRALARSTSPLAKGCLLELALARKRWYLPRRLAARSPEGLASLSVLAASWSQDPAVQDVLRLAERSRDAAVREAIRPVAAP